MRKLTGLRFVELIADILSSGGSTELNKMGVPGLVWTQEESTGNMIASDGCDGGYRIAYVGSKKGRFRLTHESGAGLTSETITKPIAMGSLAKCKRAAQDYADRED